VPTFEALGKEWLVKLDAPLALAVREECGVDLVPKLGAETSLSELAEDPIRIPLVMWVLVREQAEPSGIGRDAFVKAIVGDVAERAGLALAEAIVNFIPNAKRRETLRTMLAQDRAAVAAGLDVTLEELRALAPTQQVFATSEARRIMRAEATRLSSATSSPGNLASLPSGAPGENSTGCAQEPGGQPANAS